MSRIHPFIACAVLLCVVLGTGVARSDEDRPVVRLATVNTPYQSGLLAALLPGFERASGYRVEVVAGNDVYERADRGLVDLVISHYGKAPVEEFVISGKGLWPRPVFSNQSVLVGPKDDPAGIRGLRDPFEAMRRIVGTRSPYVSSANPTGRYLTELLLAGAGQPERGEWYIETPLGKGQAMRLAGEKGAYTVWGSYPFENFRRRHDTRLEVMVWDTPVFHRTMAGVVVNPARFPGVNADGAKALLEYLLSPATQAAIAAFREEGLDRQTWWPAGRDDNPSRVLGLVSGADEE